MAGSILMRVENDFRTSGESKRQRKGLDVIGNDQVEFTGAQLVYDKIVVVKDTMRQRVHPKQKENARYRFSQEGEFCRCNGDYFVVFLGFAGKTHDRRFKVIL